VCSSDLTAPRAAQLLFDHFPVAIEVDRWDNGETG